MIGCRHFGKFDLFPPQPTPITDKNHVEYRSAVSAALVDFIKLRIVGLVFGSPAIE